MVVRPGVLVAGASRHDLGRVGGTCPRPPRGGRCCHDITSWLLSFSLPFKLRLFVSSPRINEAKGSPSDARVQCDHGLLARVRAAPCPKVLRGVWPSWPIRRLVPSESRALVGGGIQGRRPSRVPSSCRLLSPEHPRELRCRLPAMVSRRRAPFRFTDPRSTSSSAPWRVLLRQRCVRARIALNHCS